MVELLSICIKSEVINNNIRDIPIAGFKKKNIQKEITLEN
jgi:hypothetical protein